MLGSATIMYGDNGNGSAQHRHDDDTPPAGLTIGDRLALENAIRKSGERTDAQLLAQWRQARAHTLAWVAVLFSCLTFTLLLVVMVLLVARR